MNPLAAPTFVLWLAFFGAGCRFDRFVPARLQWLAWLTALLLALPGLVFVGYYTKLMGEPIWLYQFRSLPYTELCAAGSGLLFGGLQGEVLRHPQLRRRLGKLLVPLVGFFTFALPFLKPLVGPLPDSIFAETWRDDVCLQSTPSTCGPASAATLLRRLGIVATERELARECFSSRTGTENWYLARALRKRGLEVKFASSKLNARNLVFPAIAGVAADGFGHFIPLLSVTNGMVEIGDPLLGPERMTTGDLLAGRKFTGFLMTVRRPVR